MTQLATRSGSQILRTFLPQQTADLRAGIYRVIEWTGAGVLAIDDETVRRRLLRELSIWTKTDTDNGVAADLRTGAPLVVVELDDRQGVAVEQWPDVWICRTCRRIGRERTRDCRCGVRKWGQLHFVGFHSCGAVYEPWITRCPTHDDVMLVNPRSSQSKDIRFICPTCSRELVKGLGFRRCTCGDKDDPVIRWNTHKARSVYTPRGLVLVNPPRPERIRDLRGAGGSRKALAWVIDGMHAQSPREMTGKPTPGEFLETLLRQGLDLEFAKNMTALAGENGQLADGEMADDIDTIPPALRDDAEHGALDIAMAMSESRASMASLIDAPVDETLGRRYREKYPAALAKAGLIGTDLVERFPVLNAMYGYTRGGEPGSARLVPFRNPRGGYRLHGSLSETEAFFLRLDPVRVANWLVRRGHALPGWSTSNNDARRARVAILGAAQIPGPGDEPSTPTPGSELLTLVHSYSHRFMRLAAVFSGIDRDALAEYLIPSHLGLFVYAAARGDFVLGGLQAVFESDLDSLVDTFVEAEHRCPLDPGCSRGAGACSACLHAGEPSCRHFNTYLDRRSLFGATGYLTS